MLSTSLLLMSGSAVPAGAARGQTDFSEWFALGSGCRAKFDIPGDVTKDLAPAPGIYPGYDRVRFHLPDFELTQDAQISPDRDFGRECSIRLKVLPPADEKIADVIAETEIEYSAFQSSKLTLATELKIGQQTIDASIEKPPLSVPDTSNKLPVILGSPLMSEQNSQPENAAQKPGTLFETLKCGEPKIIGLDLTWIVSNTSLAAHSKSNENDRATSATGPERLIARLGGSRMVDIFIKTERCVRE